ncbi:MAG: alkaline phosphatase family protein, partial [Casimicrobiaceae bacterium]
MEIAQRFLSLATAAALVVGLATPVLAVPPRPDHVVIVVLENHSAAQVYGNPEMPYLNWLAARGAKMTNARFAQAPYHTLNPGLPARPSQPNYLYLFSGNAQGVLPRWFQDPSSPYVGTATYANNGMPLAQPVPDTNVGIGNNLIPASRRPFLTPNLGAAIISGGGTFASFSESLPYPHYDGVRNIDPNADYYSRKHNPAINWINLPANTVPLDKARFVLPVASNLAFSNTLDPVDGLKYRGFSTDANGNPLDFSTLPTVSIVVPNEQNSGHSGSDAAADAWLTAQIKPYADWAITHNSLLIVTYDEDGATDSSRGDPDITGIDRITTVFYGANVVPGAYDEPIDHLNVLSTVLDVYGVLDTFKQDFAAAYGNTAEAGRQTANLRSILDIFGAGPALLAQSEPPYTTATILTTSGSPALAGTAVTFTATVTGSAPTGSVSFAESGTPLSGCNVVALTGSGNSKTAACTTSSLAVGTHSISASYSGDANNAAS